MVRKVPPLLFMAWLLAACESSGGVMVSEFLADNESGIKDEDDNRQDWIELYNDGATAVNLNGWWLTDTLTNKAKWQFPNVSIPANGSLLVWASGKNRRVPGQPLHTNFSLSKSGEYLGLYQPDPGTGQPVLVHDYAPTFPPQAADVSYGRPFGTSQTVILPSGASGKYKIPTSTAVYSGTNFAAGEMGHGDVNGWNRSSTFDDSGWSTFNSGLGYDANGTFSSLVATNIQSQMRYSQTSVCARMKFEIPNPSAYSSFKIRMKYEDGCGVFLNGAATPVAQYGPPSAYAYNGTAPNAASSTWQQWWETTVPTSSMVAGTNLLAIQGFNTSAGSSDFLILPEVLGVTNLTPGSPGYFSTPTPNASNGPASSGPILYGATPADPDIPRPLGTPSSPPLTVSVKAITTANPVSSVRVIPRVMYDAELPAITMLDNGVSPDLVANDKVFTANIPTNTISYGQMLRWRFEAVDTATNLTSLPAYLSTTDSARYFGTVAMRNDLSATQLPVMDWFVEGAPSTGPTASAFRGSLYYLGNFYDNIGHEIHGQSTAGLAKKSYDFDSNSNERFLWKTGENRVKDLNLLSNYADKTKTRNTLSHEVGSMMGAPYHFCFPVRVHLNAQFHGVMDLMEDGDDRMLERNGLDPEGAFYKIYAETMSTSPEKKTRLTEPNTDINTLTTSLDPALSLDTRRTYAYDNVNIAATVNYLVLRQLNSDADHGHKNYYLYRDTNVTGEWMPIVWDVDLSQGHQWNGNNNSGGYFNDMLVTDNPLNRHSSNNRLYNLILESNEFQQMFARRMRSAMDTILQAPGTTNGILETRMREIAASVDPNPANPSPETDGDLDRAKWGMNSAFIDNRPREEVERVVSGYFAPRRLFLFDQSATRPLVQKPGLTGGTLLPDNPQSAAANSVTFSSLEFLPGSDSQNGEYIILRNNSYQAIDLTGWKITGAVEHSFTAGTVIPTGDGSAAREYRGLLHVVKNTAAFRSRTTGPKGGEKRFIQGNYKGQLSARGGTLQLLDNTGAVISSHTYQGSPTAAQQFLRISEIHYNPASPTVAESTSLPGVTSDDFEFIELVNNGPYPIDLTGYRFTEGVDFTFPSAGVAAGGRVVVARNPSAFLLRHPGFSGVFGGYEGALDNSGERIELTETSGEVVLDFTYDDGWHPVTDGFGYSLVLRNPNTEAETMGLAASWLMSPTLDGSPGVADVFATISLGGLSTVYTGGGIAAQVTTTPAGLPVSVTYDGSPVLPVAAGSYAVAAAITAPNYQGSANGTLTIAKSTQTIDFPNPPDIPLDGGPLAMSATSSSGLPVEISVMAGPSGLSGNIYTPTASGAVTVRATQPGDVNRQAASPVDRAFLVTAGYSNSAWRTNHFNAAERGNPAISGPHADPDGDSLANLLEYALATDPRTDQADKAPVVLRVVHDGTVYQAIRFRRRTFNPEITLHAERGDNLSDWSHGMESLTPHGLPSANPDGTETVTFRSTAPFGTSQREFLRVKAQAAP